MLKIGICEDDPKTNEQLRDVVGRILFSYTDMNIQCFYDGEEIAQLIKEDAFQIDLLFLDIHMKRLDGMQTAAMIRKHRIDVDIIFITISKEHVFEGYTYKAFAYCLKPVNEQKLEKDLIRYIEEKENCSDCLNVNMRGKEQRIPLNKVIYFESDKRKIIAHMLTEDISFYAKLDEVEELLGGKHFLRCHTSYMVNRDMIDSLKRTEIVVQGISIPMSRKYYESMGTNMEGEVAIRVTHSLAMNQEKAGAIVFVKGKLVGAIIRIRSDRCINLGRDGNVSDIVIHDPVISRVHCSVTYNSKTGDYTICDYSKNGLYTKDGEKLPREKEVRIASGEQICIGNEENIFRLG